MPTRFTFEIGEKRLENVKRHLKENETITEYIQKSIDYKLKMQDSRYLSDFIYYLGMPFLAFLGLVGLCLFIPNIFFYSLLIVVGFYISILFYLFYNKYRGGESARKSCSKWRTLYKRKHKG